MFLQSGDPIIIRRGDIEQLLAYPKPPRDQLILELPAKMGFRPYEIKTLRKDRVDFNAGCIYVVDSKKLKPYPIPLNYDVAKLVQQCMSKDHPLVVRRLPHTRGYKTNKFKPLTGEEIWQITRRWALRARLPTWEQVNTTLLRHYFAANSTYHPDEKKRLSVETLRRIMRHKSLAYTQIYLSRLVFFEDLKADVDRLHEIPNLQRKEGESKMVISEEMEATSFYQKWCSGCGHQPVCRFMPEACAASAWSSGCKRFLDLEEVRKRVVEEAARQT